MEVVDQKVYWRCRGTAVFATIEDGSTKNSDQSWQSLATYCNRGTLCMAKFSCEAAENWFSYKFGPVHVAAETKSMVKTMWLWTKPNCPDRHGQNPAAQVSALLLVPQTCLLVNANLFSPPPWVRISILRSFPVRISILRSKYLIILKWAVEMLWIRTWSVPFASKH